MVAALAAVALIAAACGGGSPAKNKASSGPSGATKPTGSVQKGGTATVAEINGSTPNWIFPFVDGAHFSVVNLSDLQALLYRPLYWFGQGDQPTLNEQVSVAQMPKYTNGGKTVVIDLKSYKWSDGESLAAKDVVFWMNLMKAEKKNWAAYVPGNFPDNVKSVTATSPTQVTFTLSKAYSSSWFTYNQLSQVTPLPMAWDKTSMSAAAGSGGCTKSVSKCSAVYNFLIAQNKSLTGYATSPVWGVVDGPWKLSSFSSDGNYTVVPNPKYTGPTKPKLSAVKFVPYTDDAAEYNVERSGTTISVGGIPSQNLPPRSSTSSSLLPSTNPLGSKYTLSPSFNWGWAYAETNYNNPTPVGAIFHQLYARQALQMTVNQDVDIKAAFRGYATLTTGPVPAQPPSKWVPPDLKTKGPYTFDLSKAKALLTSHGWTMQGGTMVCTKPGSGSDQCGAKIPSGTKFEMKVDYSTGGAAFKQMDEEWQSDASKAGIKLDLNGQPFDTIISNDSACTPSQASCKWDIADYGEWIYAPDYQPTGGEILATGSGSNAQSYSDPMMDKLINLTHTSSDIQDFYKYADYAAKQLPGAINQPLSYGINATVSNLGGVVYNPLSTITPEDWYFTK